MMLNGDLNQSQLGTLAVCSVRYALGRRTTVVWDISVFARDLAPALSTWDLKVMLRDIEQQGLIGYGDPCDEKHWLELRGLILQELGERKTEEEEVA